MARSQFLPDNFTLTLVTVVCLASVLPASGQGAEIFSWLATAVISVLFFLHGAKLSRQAIWAGLSHWRLHVIIVLTTFVVFPLLGWGLRPLLSWLVTPELYRGVLFLCTLPATVQSAIAFASVARGNMPAAICSASGSTLLGIVVTPVLVGIFLGGNLNQNGHVFSWADMLHSIGKISEQLLLPFVVGHLVRPLIADWMKKRAAFVSLVDRSSILLVVYTAFSAAVIEGLWKQLPFSALIGLLLINAILLALVLTITTQLSRRLGFSKADEVTIVFCGSKKSLASGVPMANVLFVPSAVGAAVLPLMLFHQMQLMVCAVLAQRYARRTSE